MPADSANMEVMECFTNGQDYKAILTQPRNPGFHRKAFALAKVAFKAWEPPENIDWNDRIIGKDFDSFRDMLTIKAGYYKPVWNLDGEMILKPDSWSFAKTDQLKFEKMYSAFIDVILQDILTNYTEDDLDFQVEQVLRFS